MNSHESANKRFSFAITAGNNAHTVGRPLQIIDPTRNNFKFVFKHELIVGTPDPDRPRHVSRRDPLSIGGVTGHGDRVPVLPVNLHVERPVQVTDQNGTAIAVENGIRFRVPRDENSSSTLGGWRAGVGLCELRHGFRDGFDGSVWVVMLQKKKRILPRILGGFLNELAGEINGLKLGSGFRLFFGNQSFHNTVHSFQTHTIF